MSRVFVVLTAAGSGSRLGAAIPKALVKICGDTLLGHALSRLEALPSPSFAAGHELAGIMVSAPADYLPDFYQAVPKDFPAALPVTVVPGGQTRQGSIAAALQRLSTDFTPLQEDDLVLVHDAARCFTPPTVFLRLIQALHEGAVAVIPALPVTDTIKQVAAATPARVLASQALPGTNREDFATEIVVATPNRTELRSVQTPQGFRLKTLLELHQRFSHRAVAETTAFTDDSSLAEVAGIPVHVIPGDPLAFKITTPADLALAEILAK